MTNALSTDIHTVTLSPDGDRAAIWHYTRASGHLVVGICPVTGQDIDDFFDVLKEVYTEVNSLGDYDPLQESSVVGPGTGTFSLAWLAAQFEDVAEHIGVNPKHVWYHREWLSRLT